MTDATQPVSQPVPELPKKKPWWLVVLVIAVLVVLAVSYFSHNGSQRQGNDGGDMGSVRGSGTGDGSGRGAGTGGGGRGGSSGIVWQMMSDGNYQPSSTAPACPSPLVLAAPADLSKVVSVLYPGQVRGGNYKPHGGLRFADGQNSVTVTAPMDASLVDGSRYLVDGEVQYLFDFENSCGIRYRLGHLRTLSPTFAAVADQLPAAQDMDSRTTQINPPVSVKAGDTVATAVGLLSAGNAFFDFGVFDLRQFNAASKDPVFQAAHADDKDQAWHAVCWFDLLSPENSAKLKALPATSPGSESDYCK